MMKNHPNNKNLSMDKEKLFETFMLFQNFININNNIQNENKRQLNNEVEHQIKTKYIMNKSPKGEKENLPPPKKINYDDRPIKTSNTNFMELLEKTLSNDSFFLHKIFQFKIYYIHYKILIFLNVNFPKKI